MDAWEVEKMKIVHVLAYYGDYLGGIQNYVRELAKRHCKEEAVVVDPFAGSGSTAIALLQVIPNIQVVLIENDPDIYQKMCDRVSNWWDEEGKKGVN